MVAPVPSFVQRDMQDAIRALGQSVEYLRAGESETRTLRARCRYLNALELANSIEAYPLEVTCDARDFEDGEPRKGDTFVIDDARRGVMQVREVRVSGMLVGYRCGVQG